MGSGFIFGGAIIIALIVVGGRKATGFWAENRWRQELGHRLDNPRMVQSYREIDDVAYATRCHCLGRTHLCHEGVRSGLGTNDGQDIRFVEVECDKCEARLRLFFNVANMPN